MAALYAGMLEDAGVDVSVSELSSREVIAPALQAGKVDAVPEYLGTFTEFLNKQVNGPDAPAVANSDVTETLAAGRGLADPLGITLAEPALAADQNAFAVTREFAEKHSLEQVSTWLRSPGRLPWPGRTTGVPDAPVLPAGPGGGVRRPDQGVRPAGRRRSADQAGPGAGCNDVGLVFSSDGGVSALDLVVLEDDEALQTVDNLVPARSRSGRRPRRTSPCSTAWPRP